MARPSVEAERRDQIMRATCTTIAARGVVGLRVSDVAREAGVSPGIVHYYFDSKVELVRASFEDDFDRSLARRADILERDDVHAADRLGDLVASYCPEDAETVAAWHVWIELWAAALQDEAIRAVHERAYTRWAAMIRELISSGQERGELVAGDTEDLADHLLGLLDGLSVQVMLGSHRMTGARMRAVCGAYVESLRAP